MSSQSRFQKENKNALVHFEKKKDLAQNGGGPLSLSISGIIPDGNND